MTLEEKIKSLPEKSGVYIMRDRSGNIIYIGKAVVLKNRVRQYFNNSPKETKVQAMVDNIADFDYMITLSEKDALSMEANLIKKHKPKYNILLKDDKQSPYIKINLKDEFPCVEITRIVKKDGAKYFGPYFNGIYASPLVDIIKSCYKVRTCKKSLKKPQRECLNYHIGYCLAPCNRHADRDEYAQAVKRVVAFLSGATDGAEALIREKMTLAAEQEDFERAIMLRDELNMIERLKERTLSGLNGGIDIDSFSLSAGIAMSVISVAIVRGGKLMGVKNFAAENYGESGSELLTQFISQYYGGNNECPDEIALPFEFDAEALSAYLCSLGKRKPDIVFPKIGMKKKLLDMAKANADDYLEKEVEKDEKEKAMTVRASEELAKILGIDSARRMECYDISHISGTEKVASGVVFIDGAASKSDYRRYKIKTVEGSNDFACLAEVLKRRLKRLKSGDEKFPMPDLIVIDGGKGQLSSAYAEMQNEGFSIPMISLAKREEEVFTVGNPEPILLSKSSEPLKLLQRIRDESHRFAITYHRNLRIKRYDSRLSEIKGVGKVKLALLLKNFKNINEIAAADVETLTAINGIDSRTANSVYDFFHPKDILGEASDSET